MIAVAAVERSLYRSIRREAVSDEAHPAAAIVVMGAAEYDGVPSPVYQARLDHALDLEERGLAPLVVTTGGHGGEPRFTEAGVGRDYLIQQGVAAERIFAQGEGETTYQSVRAATRTLDRLGDRTCIVVSDGFHLYRVMKLFQSFGIRAFPSPVPDSSIESDPYLRTLYSLRELVILNLWFLHIHV